MATAQCAVGRGGVNALGAHAGCSCGRPLQHKTPGKGTSLIAAALAESETSRVRDKYDAVVVFLPYLAQMALSRRFHNTPMREMQESPMGMAERHRLHMVIGRKASLKIELQGVVSCPPVLGLGREAFGLRVSRHIFIPRRPGL